MARKQHVVKPGATAPEPGYRMNRALVALALCLAANAAQAENYTEVNLSPDGAQLTITAQSGKAFQAPVLPDQVGFQSPRISPDGKNVGWLALYPNCCTSYPIPMTLVVLDAARRIHQFEGIKLATFRWCFMPDSASVVYMQTQVHGTNYQHFEKRAIADGRLEAEYEFPDDAAENAEAQKLAPAWASCATE